MAKLDIAEVDIAKVPSIVLRRLIEEVRNEENAGNQPQMYDRVHNRHNRGNGGWGRRSPVPPVPKPDPVPNGE